MAFIINFLPLWFVSAVCYIGSMLLIHEDKTKRVIKDDPFDIDQNIQGGLIYFKWLYDRYLGDPEHLEKTLAAWNWGLNKFPKDGPLDYGSMPEETKEFIRYVFNK